MVLRCTPIPARTDRLATNTSRIQMNVAVLGKTRRPVHAGTRTAWLVFLGWILELPWNVEMSPWSTSAARTTGCTMSPLSTGVQTSWTLNDGGEAEEEGGIGRRLNLETHDSEMKSSKVRGHVPDWGLLQKSQRERSRQNGEWPRTCHLSWGKVTWKTHQSLRDI